MLCSSLPRRGDFRILFAEHFNPRNLYMLLGFWRREWLTTPLLTNPRPQIEVVVVTADEILLQVMTHTLSTCGYKDLLLDGTVTLHTGDIAQYSTASFLRTPSGGRGRGAAEQQLFDYIEYNCGASVVPDPAAQLADLTEVWRKVSFPSATTTMVTDGIIVYSCLVQEESSGSVPSRETNTGRSFGQSWMIRTEMHSRLSGASQLYYSWNRI